MGLSFSSRLEWMGKSLLAVLRGVDASRTMRAPALREGAVGGDSMRSPFLMAFMEPSLTQASITTSLRLRTWWYMPRTSTLWKRGLAPSAMLSV
jgi:hypothetical protein